MSTGLRERRVGKTALAVTELGPGGTPLGNMSRAMETETAAATVHAAAAAGIRYFDTTPLYSFGLSETRLGKGIATRPQCWAELKRERMIGELAPVGH
jgi:D-threo-aldose 1-dehydrogenase